MASEHFNKGINAYTPLFLPLDFCTQVTMPASVIFFKSEETDCLGIPAIFIKSDDWNIGLVNKQSNIFIEYCECVISVSSVFIASYND